VVFKNPEKRKLLEDILHPRIRSKWLAEAEKLEKEGHRIAVDVPLLYEVKLEKHFRHIVVVACSPEHQRERLRKRGWSDEQIRNRLSAQLTQQEKIDRADHVIWNDSTVEDAEQQLQRVLESLNLETAVK
jgi:dephospho-CoA kinase